jgi:hypothetical protein
MFHFPIVVVAIATILVVGVVGVAVAVVIMGMERLWIPVTTRGSRYGNGD